MSIKRRSVPENKHYVAVRAADLDSLEAQLKALHELLARCRPIVESEMELMDSMARHMVGNFDAEDVKSADDSADFHWILLRDIDAALNAGAARA